MNAKTKALLDFYSLHANKKNAILNKDFGKKTRVFGY
jgi:hypothetical protein